MPTTYVIAEKSDLVSIADTIRSKTGGTDELTFPDGFSNAISSISGGGSASDGVENVSWHQCPELSRNFIANVVYDPSDYSTSQIANYAPATDAVSNYRPIGKTIDGKTFYNQIPNQETLYKTTNKIGVLKPLDQLRWISPGHTWNVRDCGGWACDGGTVKYGLLYRGGYLTAADRAVMVDECGVRHELDLRGSSEAGGLTESPLGSDIWYHCPASYNWYAATPNATWRENLSVIFSAIAHYEPVYFHCSAGADRTGTLACVLEGLLGMSQSDIDKDYELTSFYSGTATDTVARRRNESEWQGLINAINSYEGDTFRDRCVSFVLACGFTVSDINTFRKRMINGSPVDIVVAATEYTITNSLTGVSSNNSATTITEGATYSATITLDSDKSYSTVQITMGGTDITTTAWNASTNTVSIANVSGNIVITIIAVDSTPANVNILTDGFKVDGISYAAVGYSNGKRLSTGSGVEKDNANSSVTGFIPCRAGSSIRIKPFTAPTSAGVGATAVVIYNSNKTFITSSYITTASSSSHFANCTYEQESTDVYKITFNNDLPSNYAYMRIGLPVADASTAYITYNAEMPT